MARLDRILSPIGFGAFKIGRNQGIKYPSTYELPDVQVVERLLNGVLDCGINFIDTAPAYGMSEERIGFTIAHRRHEFLLSTKVGETYERGESSFEFSDQGVRASIVRSLRRLRTDRLDLVFIHANRDDLRVARESDAAGTLCALRDQGTVGAVGLSAYTPQAFRVAMDWADALMLEYHPDDTSLEPIIGEAAGRGVAVFVKKPLASGRLNPETALPYVLGNPGVRSAVVGSLDLDHIRENLRIAAEVRGSLSDETKARNRA
jgi:aryl-alcohol dehydrogenase-like predicted oxidoreductase